VVRLPRVRFPRETEYSPQHSYDQLYVVRLPETSPNRQGFVGPPLDAIVRIPRHPGPQWTSSDRIAEIVQFSFLFRVAMFRDVLLTQERQQNYTETPRPPHVSESIVESSLDSNSAVSKSIVSDVGNALVHSKHTATANIDYSIPTTASPPPNPPKQMTDRNVCLDWWNGRCYRHRCKFLHLEILPPRTDGYNFVGYSKLRFTPLS